MNPSLSDQLKAALSSIETVGTTDEKAAPTKQHINDSLSNVIDMSSGKPRLKPSQAEKFLLHLVQPIELEGTNPFEIRCLYCKEVVSYPAWGLKLEFDKNVFWYFVCFNGKDKPTLSCGNH